MSETPPTPDGPGRPARPESPAELHGPHGPTTPWPPATPDHPVRRAAFEALIVNLHCLWMLTSLVVLAWGVAWFTPYTAEPSVGVLVWTVHMAALVVVGFPLGVGICVALPAEVSRTTASLVFAGVGAIAGFLLVVVVLGAAALIWFVAGGVVAGAARALAHDQILAWRSRDARPGALSAAAFEVRGRR